MLVEENIIMRSINVGNDRLDEKNTHGTVSTVYKCQTKNADKLRIYNAGIKLANSGKYDIGGTYSGEEPDFWFYYTSTWCNRHIYLMNLFVCSRKPVSFSIRISKCNQPQIIAQQYELPKQSESFLFNSSLENESHYIKTFSFSENQVKLLNNCKLLIPISIKCELVIDNKNELVNQIKLKNNLTELILKSDVDIELKSTSGKTYPVHKLIIAATSTTLRRMLKEKTTTCLSIDVDDEDMDLLLNFIYKCSVKDLATQNYKRLIEIATKFQIDKLYDIALYAIEQQLNSQNAIDVALYVKKFNVERMQTVVFKYIKKHPEVMNSEGWKQLQDIELTKSLMQYIHS